MIASGLKIVIAMGVLLDLLSCFLFVRRNKKGFGASGLPVVTFVIFYFIPILVTERSVLTHYFWLDCLILLCFHVLVVFVIPIFHKKWIARNNA